MTVPTTLLPVPTQSVLKTLTYFRQATTSQLRRLHYQGTERGTIVRSSKHLKRLHELGMVRRVWGVYQGPRPEPELTLTKGPVFGRGLKL